PPGEPRAFVFDLQLRLASSLEVGDDHLVTPLIEPNSAGFVLVRMNLVIVDDELVIDEKLAAVVRGRVKGVRAGPIDLELPFETKPVVVTPPGDPEIEILDHPRSDRRELVEVGKGLPLALVV